MDKNECLLVSLLGCGYMDLPIMIHVMDMGEELFRENIVADVIDTYSYDKINFNDVLNEIMEEIVFRLVHELEDDDKYLTILDNYWSGIYTNFMDSHFNIDCLDTYRSGDDKSKLRECLRKELLEMENNKR